MSYFLLNHVASITVLTLITCGSVINWVLVTRAEKKKNKSTLSETVSPPASIGN